MRGWLKWHLRSRCFVGHEGFVYGAQMSLALVATSMPRKTLVSAGGVNYGRIQGIWSRGYDAVTRPTRKKSAVHKNRNKNVQNFN